MTDYLSGIAIWSGGIVGILKLLDWLVTSTQKETLRRGSETAWLWLSYQRAGKFTNLLKSRRTQIGLAVATHVMMLILLLAYLWRDRLPRRWDIDFQLGHPRLYPFQLWIDIASLLVSAVVVSYAIHPRVSGWIAGAATTIRYMGRALIALAVCFGGLTVLLVVEYPIIGFSSPAMTLDGSANIRHAYEEMLGGPLGVVGVHALTAAAAAPVMAEGLLVQTIFFLSLYWIVIVAVMILLFRTLQFVLLRVVESRDGPVLALSGFLIGIGALAKAVLGK